MIEFSKFIPNGYITCGIGNRLFNGKNQYHAGLDMSTRNPMRVVNFPCAGKIVYAGWSETFGFRIWVKSPIKGYYVLAHFDELSQKISVGNSVNQYDLAGFMGNTGRSQGLHTHWEFRLDPSSPETYFVSEYQTFLINNPKL